MDNQEYVISQIMNMIAYGGEAQSIAANAIDLAKNGQFEEAHKILKQGEESLVKSHEANTNLLVKEANGEQVNMSLLLIHGTEHLMNGQVLMQLSKEIVHLYEELEKMKGEVR